MEKRDYIIIAVITLAFAVLAFYRLGSFTGPETYYEVTAETPVILLDFGETVAFDYFVVYFGPECLWFEVYIGADGSEWELTDMGGGVWQLEGGAEEEWEHTAENRYAYESFAWKGYFHGSTATQARYLLMALHEPTNIWEMVFLAPDNQRLVPVNAAAYPGIFDEQWRFDPYISYTYYDRTIFDEFYHGRTAYEYMKGLPGSETGHPPLGKLLLIPGIAIFGMVPFGWRFMAAVFGIMTVPLIYAFTKALVGSRFAAAAAALLLAADCMHLTLSRLGTIDTIAGFWILLMNCLFWLYLKSRSYLPLALCGLVFGIGVATKWTSLFAGAGLALMFLFHIIMHRPPRLARLIAFCTVFFVALPALIYILSYIPVIWNPPLEDDSLLSTVAASIEFMSSFHFERQDENPLVSAFYEWLIVWKPLSYSSGPLDAVNSSSVNLMGNVAIWWFGLPCLLFCLYRAAGRKDGRAAFLLVAYAAQMLPWVLVSHHSFIYHYYPATLFMIPAIAYTLDIIARAREWGRTAVYGYLAVAVAVFIVFYPVASGIPAPYEYQLGLEWLPEWELVQRRVG
ncbi:MAG: phospholipid carrier-dependent glycosyltransferase [Lachnospiraceae bacterium]|jgi:dolichyl-phosphate-mannose--protein O-mannosyl transferase|nr:phospholipid carrier-dependent glycosyltransferase [Lachnospiraceae bacterium]